MLKPFVLALSVMATTLSASAQGTFDSFGLDDINAWGIGSLSNSDGALPNTLWQNSSEDDLSSLFSQTSIQALSPSMRELVRRAVLSSAVAPDGEKADALLVQRYDIIQDLGDPKVFEDFVRQSSGTPGIVSHFELTIDNDFAKGNLRSACSLVRASSQQTTYLLRARAVCYALEEDYSPALVALEFISGEGADDVWYMQVINAMSRGEKKNLPPPRYGSGMTLALSIGANLIPEKDGFVGLHPGLATQVINRSNISRKLRIQAAEIAFAAGVLDRTPYRRAYAKDKVAPPPTPDDATDPKPEPEQEPFVPVSLLDEAYETVSDQKTDLEQALVFRRTLSAYSHDVAQFRAASNGLWHFINGLNNPVIAQQFGDSFALSALSIGEYQPARRFINGLQSEGSALNNPFLIGWLDAFPILAGEDTSPQSAIVISRTLAETSDEKTKPAAIRMIRGFLALGLPVSVEARQLIATADEASLTAGRTVSEKDLLLIKAAFQSDALGEAVLRTAIQVGYNPAELNGEDLARLAGLLSENGLKDVARQLVIEGIGYQLPIERTTFVTD